MSISLCQGFEGHDRFGFDEGISRVTGGPGCEVFLITRYEKTVLIDCGMAFCAADTIENIRRVLGERKLDCVFVTHSHYDHIGALPYILNAFPDAAVYGSEKCRYVFSREGARKVISKLGSDARDLFTDDREEIIVDGLRVDQVVSDMQIVDIGGGEIVCLETKGHTDCCMSFVLEPDSILFGSESTGVLQGANEVCAEILKSYSDSMESLRKCREYGAKHYVCPHFGLIPDDFQQEFFDKYLEFARRELKLVKEWYAQGLDDDQVLEKYVEEYWSEERASEQPMEAFLANAVPMIKVLKEA